MDNEDKSPRAWVIFSGHTDIRWLRFLRPGFRHCFVLMNDGRHWITLDPLSHHTEISVHHVPPTFDLPGWLTSRGQRVVMARPDYTHRKAAPWMPFTCVEAVKRVLGIHKRGIWTPWQLYQHLTEPAFNKQHGFLQEGDFSWAA